MGHTKLKRLFVKDLPTQILQHKVHSRIVEVRILSLNPFTALCKLQCT
jgi:hypothetical protein